MILMEEAPVAVSTLPVAAFRDHLRLGTGFADDGAQDGLLEAELRSALQAVETRTGKAVLARAFLWQITAWRGLRREELPIAPVATVEQMEVIEPDGTVTEIAPDRYAFEGDAHRPAIVARGFALPTVPVGGRIEMRFRAGYSADWAGVPNDLKQAIFLLAADYHETRHGAGTAGLPPRVAELLRPYQPIRLFGRRA